MSYDSGSRWTTRATVTQAEVDVGLRQYMLRVYNYMASGLVLTGIVALVFSQYLETHRALVHSPVMFLIMLAPLGLVMWFSFGLNRMQASTAQALFWAIAGATGLSLGALFLYFTGDSIARVFFITAGTFAAMSLYGYTTRRDLTAMGAFMWMGLIGIVIAILVNYVLALFGAYSSALQFAISVIGVIVFVGLTAFDTQRLKEEYYTYQYADGQTATKSAVSGALTLYLDFYNLFVFLLQLIGVRSD